MTHGTLSVEFTGTSDGSSNFLNNWGATAKKLGLSINNVYMKDQNIMGISCMVNSSYPLKKIIDEIHAVGHKVKIIIFDSGVWEDENIE